MILKERMSFHWFSSNSEAEATWFSLILWPHKTSNKYHLYLCINSGSSLWYFWYRYQKSTSDFGAPSSSDLPDSKSHYKNDNMVDFLDSFFDHFGAKYLVLSPLIPSKWENLALLSLYTFWGKCVYFSIYNDVFLTYFFFMISCRILCKNIIVNFIIQQLKNKHTFLKKYTNWAKLSSLVLTEREDTKPDILHNSVVFPQQNKNVTNSSS